MHLNIYIVWTVEIKIKSKRKNVCHIVYFQGEEKIGGEEDRIHVLLYHVYSFTNTQFDFNYIEEKWWKG